MVLADMPVTPLANAMWRFGDAKWLPGQGGSMHSKTMLPGVAEPTHTTLPRKTDKTEMGKAVSLSDAVCNTQCEKGTRVATKTPHTTVSAAATSAAASALCMLEPVAQKMAARVAHYESIDPVTGRVWGMPSAFGRGQCLDCPNKASPPSNKCRACQSRSNSLMPAGAIERVKIVLDKRLPHVQERSRADVAQRLSLLYVDMKAGHIEQTLQGQLQALAEAIEAHGVPEARRLTAAMVSQHWQQHKAWLKGLKTLLAEL
jgi:hypothetical protein